MHATALDIWRPDEVVSLPRCDPRQSPDDRIRARARDPQGVDQVVSAAEQLIVAAEVQALYTRMMLTRCPAPITWNWLHLDHPNPALWAGTLVVMGEN